MQTTRIIDISPPLTPAIAVWPGDTAFRQTLQLQIEAGHNITLSSLTTTVHVGAHADAPSHYHRDGLAIDAVDLQAYIGPCEVISVIGKSLIAPEDCMPALQRGGKRLLFRTLSQPSINVFNPDFTAFDAAAIQLMGQAGVVLIGIDTPSVDPAASKTLPAHHAMITWAMRNLEGLDLRHVADGSYELIALPLRLVGFDASPVRAVLRTL